MTKGLSQKIKGLITDLRTLGNSDEEIAEFLKIDISLVNNYKSLKLNKSEDDEEEMIRLYREGFSTAQIGKKLGWHLNTVRTKLKKAIPDEIRTKRRIDSKTDEAIKQMLAEGCTSKEIKDKLNVSYQVIKARKENFNSYKHLTTDELREIAYLLYIDKKKITDIAKQFDVHQATISRVKAKIEKAGGYEKWLESTK